MEKHPYFDLWLHSNQALTEQLGVEIVERVTLHEWPLSCVQLLHLADGNKVIYKSQLSASSIEPEFYNAVNNCTNAIPTMCHSLQPRADILGVLENSVGMIFEYIPAPRLEDLQLTEAEIVEHGSRLIGVLRQLPINLPVYIDISSQGKWLAFADDTCAMLHNLIAGSVFHLTTAAIVQRLSDWSKSEAVLSIIQEPPVYNHGDLCGDNIFIIPNGYKIIDWQRPVRGPAQLDLAMYYFAMGLEPYRYIPCSIIELNWFLHLRWLAECKLRWFPPGEIYDRQVANLAELILLPRKDMYVFPNTLR